MPDDREERSTIGRDEKDVNMADRMKYGLYSGKVGFLLRSEETARYHFKKCRCSTPYVASGSSSDAETTDEFFRKQRLKLDQEMLQRYRVACSHGRCGGTAKWTNLRFAGYTMCRWSSQRNLVGFISQGLDHAVMRSSCKGSIIPRRFRTVSFLLTGTTI